MAHARGNRMRKGWLPIGNGTSAMTANGTFQVGFVNFTGPGTVLRMLGEYIIHNTATVVADDAVLITVGIGLLSTDAIAVAAAAGLPDPGEEPEYPWLYWAEHPLRFPKALSTTISGDSVSGVVRRSFDIRSMRKFKEREGLVVAVQYGNLAGTPPITITMARTRVLVGL